MFEKDLNISLLLDFYGDILCERQRDMLDMYYNDDFSLSEIADNYNISRQGVRSVLKKGEIILNDFESKLHLVEKFNNVKEISVKVSNELVDIQNHTDNKDIRDKIQNVLFEIKEISK